MYQTKLNQTKPHQIKSNKKKAIYDHNKLNILYKPVKGL